MAIKPALRWCITLLTLGTPALWAGVSVPDWVHQAASQTLPTYPADTNAVVMLSSFEDTVNSANEYVEHYRRVVKILRPDGRHEGEFWTYLRKNHKVLSIHAWSIDSSGHEYEMKDKDFVDNAPFSDELYSDIHFRVATVPAAQPGSIVALEYSARRDPLLDQLDWDFQEDIPVRQADFSVLLPSGWEYKASWKGATTVNPLQIANGWKWTLQDVPAIVKEPRRPVFGALGSRMEVAYFAPGAPAVGSWQGIAQWYDGLVVGRRNPTPAITAKVHELTAGTPDFDGKLRVLARFLQAEIRYVAIEIGIGGFQPHPAGDIFRVRYGDCKDKATLLSAMLAEAGVRSDYLVINTYRGIANPDLPDANSFNHMILAIELPADAPAYRAVYISKAGKKYLIFDPTDEYTPIGDLRSELQQNDGLLVTDAGGELIHIPLFPPDGNMLARTGQFKLSDDGALSGEITEVRTGDHASRERAMLRHASEQERTQRLEHWLNGSIQGFTLESTNIQQLDQPHEKLVVNMKFSTPNYAQSRGPLVLVRPRVLDEKSFAIETKPRRYPIVLGGTSDEKDSYEIELPESYAVDDVPDPVNIDMDFASYHSKTEVEGRKLRYTRELVVRSDQVESTRIGDLRKFEGMIGADEVSAVILKRTPH